MNATVPTVHQFVDEICGDEIIAATVKGLIVGYDARWRHTMAGKTIEAMERTYTGPLKNIETGGTSRTWQVAGKIDKLVCDHEGRTLYDHKTTSQDIEDPDAVYWRTLQVDSQHQHYELLLLLNAIEVDRIVWDVVRKPGIRPKKIAKKERQYIVAEGRYCGQRVSPELREVYQKEERENAELYMLRVAAEVTENPARYFARRAVVRTRAELAEYVDELWQAADTMRQARNEGRHYRNPGACLNYGTPCTFLGVCSGHDTIESDNWRDKPNRHEELDYDGDGLDLLSNSRVRSFLTCRRKHYYEFELARERVDAEDREALTFGRIWHAALDVFCSLTCRNGENENGYPSATAGSEPAIAGQSAESKA